MTRIAPSATADAIEHRVRDLSRWGRPIVLALHRPPLPHAWRAWQWLDVLRGHRRLFDLLERSGATEVRPSPGLASTVLEKGRAA